MMHQKIILHLSPITLWENRRINMKRACPLPSFQEEFQNMTTFCSLFLEECADVHNQCQHTESGPKAKKTRELVLNNGTSPNLRQKIRDLR